jgi:UDP-N-acetylglucosamine--N-acetylmuramyl-(pentapeptide) pyrophosphoryl-undecaprenol N-acetylglucosamine transferase
MPRIRARRWLRSHSTLELAQGGSSCRAPIEPRTSRTTRPRLFVTVGTYEYSFVRLFERLETVVPDEWDIIWQVGHVGTYRPTRGEVREFIDYDRMLDETRRADVIITHAGVGSILTVLEAGRLPIVVARRQRHGEIADDHQLEVLAALRQAGITAFDDVDDIDADVFACRGGTGEAVA